MKYYTIFLLFGLVYIGLNILLLVVLNFVDFDFGSSLGFSLTLASVFWVTYTYGKRNGYFFTTKQKWGAVFGFSVIDICFQSGIAFLLFYYDDSIDFSGLSTTKILMLAAALAGLSTLASSLLGIFLAKKQLLKMGLIS